MGNTENKKFSTAQLVFLISGVLIIIIGFLATGSRLAEFVSKYVSDDKNLSEETMSVLNGLKIKIILTGIGFVLISALLKLIPLLKSILTKHGPNIFVSISSFLKRIVNVTYKIVKTEKFIWGFIIVVLLTISLPTVYYSPAGGFHVEGLDLQPPINLIKHGIFGTLTTNGFDTESNRTSAGPGILMPITLVFKIFGISEYNGRFVHLFFLIGTILMFYFVFKNIFGRKVALLGLLMAFTPYMIMVARGHTGMGTEGYIPALFYLLVGTHFWFKAIEDNKNIYLILAGLFYGFSFQTKWLYLFAIPSLILTCIVLSFTAKSLKSKNYIIPTVMVIVVTAGWTLFRILNVGLRAEIFHLQKFWAEHSHRGLGEGIFILDPIIRAFTNNVYQINLWEDLQLFLIVPAFIYIFVLIRKSKWTDYKILFFMSFSLIWFFWWALFNFDLPETHLRTFLIISQVFIAKLFYDFWQYSFQDKITFIDLIRDRDFQKNAMLYSLRVAVVLIVLAKVLVPVIEKANFLNHSKKNFVDPYKEMVSYIEKNTEKDAVFSGWAISMPWYLGINSKIDRINKDRNLYPPEQREKVPEYFIVSPEWPLVSTSDTWPNNVETDEAAKASNRIRKKFLEENATLLKTFGGEKHKWHLYKVINKNLAQQSIE